MNLVDVQRWDAKLQIASLQDLPSRTLARAFALTAEQAKTELGGYELEFVLAEKPNRNVINIPFNKDNVVLYYQLPLTEEFRQEDCEVRTPTYVKTKDGCECSRPERVVGSYAVYHASKRNNEYKTGKICHIFRPKLVDADGKIAWAEFNRDANETGVLTVTMPQEFLDSGKYPVVVDPTFGYTSIGASEWSYGGQQAMWACRFTMLEAGNITSITAYVRSFTGTQGSKTAIYANSGGSPAARLALSSVDIPLDTTSAWREYAISYAGVNTDYHLTFACQDGGRIRYDTGGATNQEAHRTISDYTNPPNPFGTPAGQNPYKVSIYATYMPSAVLKEVADALGLSDAVLRNKPLVSITDTFGVADSIKSDKTFAVTDILGLADSVLGNKTPLIVSDAVSLADLIDVITGAIIKTVLDSVNLADVAKVLKTLNVSDALSLVDVVHTPSRVLWALDSVGLADGAYVTKVLLVTENISLVEVAQVGVAGVKKTRLFLILGDLAVQLTSD